MSKQVTLKCGSLDVSVMGYQFPKNTGYWDGNWLVVSARCGQEGRFAKRVANPCLRTTEFAEFLGDLRTFEAGLTDVVELRTLEPYVGLKIVREPDALIGTAVVAEKSYKDAQAVTFPVDDIEIAQLMDAVACVLDAFPIRGKQP